LDRERAGQGRAQGCRKKMGVKTGIDKMAFVRWWEEGKIRNLFAILQNILRYDSSCKEVGDTKEGVRTKSKGFRPEVQSPSIFLH